MFLAELSSQHAQKLAELEEAMQQKLRQRQKVYEEAFNQDMKQYLSTGYLQNTGKEGLAENRKKSTSELYFSAVSYS